ncbi:chlorite dismutase family protein [Brachybacterium sp. MASK1Z-5]|uniref:Coproheme decarboxylase n=1 Tax=Brachybacterium halotolerans TaxID=2795215 RepID=A0ABS1B7X8_9MICO|nr:hydrogen peroxide-dependent heme synthase [Brachybacterium halotolerans]MBK0330766.1 chlorite dismutase family protein [Brachybacterium halotolerans]
MSSEDTHQASSAPAATAPSAASTPSTPSAPTGGETVRYTSYTVFTRVEAADAPREQVAAEVAKVVAAIEAEGTVVRGIYDASLFRAEADLMLWMHAETPEALQDALRRFERTRAAEGLVRSWSAVGVHREAEFSRSHAPAFLSPSRTPQQWVTVYPFTRSYEWYLLPDEERRDMLIEHGTLGRTYPQVHANTVAAFALGDWEWLLSFESDDLHDLVDMMRALRYTGARLHVRDELPFHVGRRLAAADDVAAILV